MAASEKASILTEALPYILRWRGEKVVIKTGGEILEQPGTLDDFATDVALLSSLGMKPLLIHGGGPQISSALKAQGIAARFVSGLRVTTPETLAVAGEVLWGQINQPLVAELTRHGARAAGIRGESVFRAQPIRGDDGGDLGLVGEVSEVDDVHLEGLLDGGVVPVLTPLGLHGDGPININADAAAGSLASALGAQKLVVLTNVEGLYADLGDEGSLISELSREQLEALLSGGSATDGMVPKLRAAVAALSAGVPQVHLLDGRQRHALLLEIFTDEGVGTMVVP